MAKATKNYHVTPDPKGGWNVRHEKQPVPVSHTDTQAEAISDATQRAKNEGSEVIIHGRNGQIRERNSYGNDPHPPKG